MQRQFIIKIHGGDCEKLAAESIADLIYYDFKERQISVGNIEVVETAQQQDEIYSAVWMEWDTHEGVTESDSFESHPHLLRVGYKAKSLGRVPGIHSWRQARRFAIGWLATQEL